MDVNQAKYLLATLPDDARVVDIGGGASPFSRADYVIDALPFRDRGALGEVQINCTPRYSEKTWIQLDLCDHRPWPFDDRFFDFATCSHLLEDVRDPIWICHELCRVAKAGYIEVPSRIVEQSLGVEHPRFAGFYHHRWLINSTNDTLEFRHKPHLLHSVNDAIVARVGINRVINPKYQVLVFHWSQSFNYREILEFDEETVVRELCGFARTARALPDLTVPSDRSCWERFKRWIYYRRLSRGRR